MKASKKKAADIYYTEEADPNEIAYRIACKKHIGVLDWGDPENMIFVMVGDGRNPEVAKRINRIKGRPENQVLAIAGFDGLVGRLGELDKAKALHINNQSPQELVKKLFELPVGMIVPAKVDTPDWVTTNELGQKRIMIAGQSHNPLMEYADLFNQVVHILANEYDTFCAGTSANRADKDIFTVYQQEEAYEELKNDVDFFVMRRNLDFKLGKKRITSCTAIELDKDKAVLRRWGSKDIHHFKKHLKKLTIPDDINIHPDAEIFLRSIFRNKMNPLLRLKLLRMYFFRLQSR